MNENTVQLPPAFLTRMEEMLGSEYSDFLASFDAPRTYGLRVNTSKINCRDFEKLTPFSIRSIPWIKNGYFYEEDVPSIQMSLLSGRSLLSPGAKRHDPYIPHSD